MFEDDSKLFLRGCYSIRSFQEHLTRHIVTAVLQRCRIVMVMDRVLAVFCALIWRLSMAQRSFGLSVLLRVVVDDASHELGAMPCDLFRIFSRHGDVETQLLV